MKFEGMKSNRTGRALAILGLLLQIGPLVGMGCAMVSMVSFQDKLMVRGGVDQSALQLPLAQMFAPVIIGFAVGVVGAVLMVLALTVCRYRAEWFFWFVVVFGVLSLGAFPIGTGFGVFFLVYALTKRDEFLKKPVAVPSVPMGDRL